MEIENNHYNHYNNNIDDDDNNNKNMTVFNGDRDENTICLDGVEKSEFTQKCCDKLSIDLWTNVTTDLLMIPIMTSGIRCLLQGLDLFIDSVSSTSQTIDIVGANVIPASHTYFRDIFECATTTYNDCGLMGGFCKGLGAIVLGSAVKYCVVKIFKKMVCFYQQDNNQLSTSLSYYED